MLQGLQEFLISIVSGSISGIIVAIAIAFGAAGLATGVWNPKKQMERVKDVVPKFEFAKRWKAWLTYQENVNARGPDKNTPFHQLVREINREFTSFPHPNFPPGSKSDVVATLSLDALPVLTRNDVVRGAIDKVRSTMANYPALDITELLSHLYWLIN